MLPPALPKIDFPFNGLVDGICDGHADRVGQPPAAGGQPVEELVGSSARVGADERLPSPSVLLRQLLQGEPGGFDMVRGGIVG